MSWLAGPLVSSLGLNRGAIAGDDADADPTAAAGPSGTDAEEGEDERNPGRGVKEDLSELTETLTRQLLGVASFLAPPPTRLEETLPPLPDSGAAGSADLSESRPREISAADGDRGEVMEEWDDGESGGGVIGLTEEVLAFARNISMHPETWLDCPLLPDEDEPDDFEMSDAQQEHALAIEYLVPRLAALRIELCPVHMSEECFWKIYFVLVHPRLHKDDAEYLSTSQIVEARSFMLQELQNRMKSEIDRLVRSRSYEESSTSTPSREDHISPGGMTTDGVPVKDKIDELIPSFENHLVLTEGIQTIDKDVSEEREPEAAKSCNPLVEINEDEDDAWLADDDDVIEVNSSGIALAEIDNEGISFSDLEDSD